MSTPGWEARSTIVVVGTGVAGLTTAIDAAAGGAHVLLLTKASADEASTTWAQGGIAVVRADRDPGDSVAAHISDTLTAGAGLADPQAVSRILRQGPGAIARLIARGAHFDADGLGLLRTREGGHRANRVIHAGGDATGAEIERALLGVPGLPAVLTGHLALDVVMDEAGAAVGLMVLGDDGTFGLVRADAVVLATGGAGHLFAATTNPDVATADGLAMALRVGAVASDVEFMQFHPTALWTGGSTRGRRPLVTEAVRGEGAVLIDGAGNRVMTGVHPMEDLAPRDVVSLAVTRRLATAPGGISDHVFLDATKLGRQLFAARFPTVSAACAAAGIDPASDPIPVSPAAHYHCGGVVTDVNGRTSVPGLFAVGEVARTGLHGANRLASNSLLEGLVMGERVAAAVLAGALAPAPKGRIESLPTAQLADPWRRADLQTAMTRYVSIGRDEVGLDLAAEAAVEVAGSSLERSAGALDRAAVETAKAGFERSAGALDRAAVETANLALAARAVLAAARARMETRGSHVRIDHPSTDPASATSIPVQLVDGNMRAGELLSSGTRR